MLHFRPSYRVFLGLVGVASLLGVACGGESAAPRRPAVTTSQTVEESTLAVELRARSSMASRGGWYPNLAAAMPTPGNRRSYGLSATDSVIVGVVEEASEGVAFIDGVEGTAEAPRSRMVKFNDIAASWRTIHLRVRVEKVIGGSMKKSEVIAVGLAISGSSDTAQALIDASSIGRAAFFLTRTSPVFAYDEAMFSIVGDGMLMAVETNGSYGFPFADPALAAPLLGDKGLQEALVG